MAFLVATIVWSSSIGIGRTQSDNGGVSDAELRRIVIDGLDNGIWERWSPDSIPVSIALKVDPALGSNVCTDQLRRDQQDYVARVNVRKPLLRMTTSEAANLVVYIGRYESFRRSSEAQVLEKWQADSTLIQVNGARDRVGHSFFQVYAKDEFVRVGMMFRDLRELEVVDGCFSKGNLIGMWNTLLFQQPGYWIGGEFNRRNIGPEDTDSHVGVHRMLLSAMAKLPDRKLGPVRLKQDLIRAVRQE